MSALDDQRVRLAFLEIGSEDARNLESLKPVLEKHADSVVAAFYRHLLSFEETHRLLADPDVKSRLLVAQREYLLSLADAPIDAAYFASQFWDGRSADLEDHSQHPFINPVEMGLPDHEPILKVVRSDPTYVDLFRNSFGIEPAAITMEHVKMAIASFAEKESV